MVYLLWLIRGYSFIVIAWALLSWLPFPFFTAIRNVLGYAVVPVVNLFSFAGFGGLSIAPMLVLLILYFAERAVFNKIIKNNPHYDPQDLR